MIEIWRAIPGYEGGYEASSLGRVRSLDRYVDMPCVRGHCRAHQHFCHGRVLRPGPANSGHLSVVLGRDNTQSVHVLVLLAFVGPPELGQEARHLNGRPACNRLDNLEWASRQRNSQDKKHHNGAGNYKLRPAQVRQIKRALLKPRCGLQHALAKHYSVSDAMISAIKRSISHSDIVL